MNEKVTEYINKNENWKNELQVLRSTLLQLNLEETIKWGAPTYIYNAKNVVGIAGFKSYLGLWFFQGALLKDKHKVLINAQENKTKAMRQWRFFSTTDINTDLIKAYVLESIDNFKVGKEIKPKRITKHLILPKELEEVVRNNKELALKFNEFSLSKKREFCEYISSAKRETTKQNRLEKIIPMILNGVGLHDKYRNS